MRSDLFCRYFATIFRLCLLSGRCLNITFVFFRSDITQCLTNAIRSTKKLAVMRKRPITAKITHYMNLSDLCTLYDLLYIKIIIILWKNSLTNDRGSNAAVYKMNRINETQSTGRYAIHNITLFHNSGFFVHNKIGAKNTRITLIGGGSEMSALYLLSGEVCGLILSVSSMW